MSVTENAGRVVCAVVGYRWRTTAMRVTHGRVECERCGAAEWRQN